MKIGIKYCGGCNPRFNRREIVEHLMEKYRCYSFEVAEENVCYDILLLINGCLCACATHNSLIGKEIFILKSEYEIKNLIDFLSS